MSALLRLAGPDSACRRTKRKDIYVISTAKRPVPLEHYLYAGRDLHKIVDAERNFIPLGYELPYARGIVVLDLMIYLLGTKKPKMHYVGSRIKNVRRKAYRRYRNWGPVPQPHSVVSGAGRRLVAADKEVVHLLEGHLLVGALPHEVEGPEGRSTSRTRTSTCTFLVI